MRSMVKIKAAELGTQNVKIDDYLIGLMEIQNRQDEDFVLFKEDIEE